MINEDLRRIINELLYSFDEDEIKETLLKNLKAMVLEKSSSKELKQAFRLIGDVIDGKEEQ